MTASPASRRVPTTSEAKDAVSGRASREVVENGHRVPASASPRPDASRPRPVQVPALWDGNALTRPALSIKRDAGRGPSGDAGLATWIDSLKARDLTIATGPDGPTIGGHNLHLVTPDDTHHLAWHRHALELAAQGDHPGWWNHVLGRADRLDVDDMPTVPDPRDQLAGSGWPCACCGLPADLVTPDGLPWCKAHA